MPCVKTAVSLRKPLFQKVETSARQMKVPRSQLITLALEEFFRRRQNKGVLKRLNEVYSGDPDPEEEALMTAMGKAYRRTMTGKW